MEDREPTIRSRELGDGLRSAMVRAKLTGKAISHQLEWSPARVSRLLSGKRGGSELDVVSFMAICRVTGNERERLLKLCRDADTPGWLQKHGGRLPKQLLTLIDHENKSVAIHIFQAMAIDGLFQTAEYARALISVSRNVPKDEIDDRVAARLARQGLLSRRPLVRFVFFIHEFALRLPVGGPEVMSEQLHHLLRLSVRPNITLRIVPAAIGGHAGISGHFQLMEFADFRPVVYLDSETSCLFLEEHVEINAYQRILNGLADIALDEGQSRELIAKVVVELYSSGDDHD
jgi:hypothetical protein